MTTPTDAPDVKALADALARAIAHSHARQRQLLDVLDYGRSKFGGHLEWLDVMVKVEEPYEPARIADALGSVEGVASVIPGSKTAPFRVTVNAPA